MPCLWNQKLIMFLPNNFNLAKNVLKSTLKKYKSKPQNLTAYDNVIKEQLKTGIITTVKNINSLKYNDQIAFIAHNAVFRDEVQTTKCRVVYLSNLCEKGDIKNLSHNQISQIGRAHV